VDLELRAPAPDDLGDYFAIRAQAFAIPGSEREAWISRAEPDTMLCAFSRGRMVGALRAIPFGQWFGGRCLPMGGLASVVVAPEARGRGVAARLLGGVLERLHEQGTLVSTLHPATVKLYRGAGWEVGGDFAAYRVPSRSLARLHRGEPERVRRLARAEWPLVQQCYERAAPSHPGWVQRTARWWEQLADARFVDQGYAYGIEGEDDELAGYVCFTQRNHPDQWGYGIRVHELVALTPEAGTTLWSLMGGHSMQVESVVVPGALLDDLALLLPENDVTLIADNPWMHRLVDVPGALVARGWPASVTAELHLQVSDPLASWNAGRHVLKVEGGHAEVRAGGTGETQIGVGALSALAAGRFSARTLAGAGLLHHADPPAVDAVFAAPRPHLLDDF
jgi:predicted acetyltransferase